MTLGFILAVLLQAGAAPPPADPALASPHQTFIAPSGEPFRAPPGAPYPSAAWFAGADADHDGKLTYAEFVSDFMRFVRRIDANRDGVVDSGEVEAYESRIAPEVTTWGDDGGLRGSGTYYGDDTGGGEGADNYRSIGGSSVGRGLARGGARFDLLRLRQPVTAMDFSLNGRISSEEAMDSAAQRFDLLDPDHKGYLSLEGLPHTVAQDRGGTVRKR